MRLYYLFLVLPGLVAAISCNAIFDLERYELDPGSGGSGGSGGTVDAGCSHATYLPPPVDAATGGSERFVVALRRVWLGELPDGGYAGLDLDLTCTCQGEGPTCASAAESCDEAEGRDSAMAALFEMLNTVLQLPGGMSSYFSQAAEDGYWTTLMRVEDYNGEADDGQVTLSWYTTTGLDSTGGGPSWDGQDQWPVSEAVVDTGSGGDPLDHPLYTDPHAYITDHVLVAALPRAELNMVADTTRMVLLLTGGGLMARLEPTPEGWALRDGVLGARIPPPDLFNMLSSFRDGVSQPICMDNMLYPYFHEAICSAPDILIQPLSASSPCEAVSFGLGFEADPAQLGAVEPASPVAGGCPIDTDPAYDSCD